MAKVTIPTYDTMMSPLIQALRDLGGSGTIEEIEEKVAEILGLTDEQLEAMHDPEKRGQPEFSYRLAWTRSYLKRFGLIENSNRGIWALTAKGNKTDKVNEKEIVRYVREQSKNRLQNKSEDEPSETGITWRDELLATLQHMSPDAFERLVQRLLRESGFIQVEVTGRSGDGGIDGHGIMRLGGLLSFHVIFQCKKYQNSVAPSQIRDFRGAMVGRADKGLFVTTGTFTKEAIREATRDGAPAIDLIDGELLINKLKELGLGVKTIKVEIEQVTIDPEWFRNL
jgi:restriction system protein